MTYFAYSLSFTSLESSLEWITSKQQNNVSTDGLFLFPTFFSDGVSFQNKLKHFLWEDTNISKRNYQFWSYRFLFWLIWWHLLLWEVCSKLHVAANTPLTEQKSNLCICNNWAERLHHTTAPTSSTDWLPTGLHLTHHIHNAEPMPCCMISILLRGKPIQTTKMYFDIE